MSSLDRLPNKHKNVFKMLLERIEKLEDGHNELKRENDGLRRQIRELKQPSAIQTADTAME